MEIMWCGKCKQDVPMLDEEEYSKVWDVYTSCIKNVKRYREATGLPLQETPEDKLYMPVTLEYNMIAGIDTNFNYKAILKHPHRISRKGLPCKVCGKVLSTTYATICTYCNSRVDET